MDEQSLIDALHERPEDDGARLVYADWLDEHGQTARAELLRVQVERKNLAARDPRADELEAREAELVAQTDAALPVSDRLRKKVVCRWHLGLLSASVVDRAKLTDANLDELVRTPNLTEVRDFQRLTPAQLPRLAECPGLRTLSADRPGGLTDEHVQALQGVPQVRTLALRNARLGDGVLRHLAALRGLTHLDLTSCTFDDGADLAPLVALTGLTRFTLSYSGVDDDGLSFVSALRRLTRLDLAYTPITDAGLRHLKPLRELTDLDLGGTGVGDGAADALAGLKRLHTLRLHSAMGITDANVMRLAKLKALRYLDLTWAGVTRIRLPPFLAAAKQLERIRVGALHGNPDYRYDNREIDAFREICAENDVIAEVDLVEMDYE